MTISRLYVFAPIAGEHCLAGRIDWQEGVGDFRYAPDWLADPAAYALDPRNLPLGDGPFSTTVNGGIHGVLADAGPDAWGKRLLELHRGRVPDTPLEVLRVTNGAGTGALLFSQSRERPAPVRLAPATTLAELEDAARHVDAGEPVSEHVFELIFASGSPLGGARPKANITLDGDAWIAKFAKADDTVDMPRVEWACLTLARRAGLDVPDHRLVNVNGRAVLLVRRFDRGNPTPLHYLSLHALLSAVRMSLGDVIAPEGLCTYGGMASLCRQIGVPDAGTVMFHRLAMNLAIGNTDDHLRNQGLLHDIDGWRFAPAFDLTATGGAHQAIGVGTAGREATRENALSDLPRFGLSLDQARALLHQVDAAMASAQGVLRDAGLPPLQVEQVLNRMRIDPQDDEPIFRQGP